MNVNLIPDRLITVRKQHGLNKADAARLLSLSKMGYGRYESGDRSPSPQMLEMIAQKLHTSVAYLTGTSSSPDEQYVVISKQENLSLFSLVKEMQSCDELTLMRLTEYYKKIANINNVKHISEP